MTDSLRVKTQRRAAGSDGAPGIGSALDRYELLAPVARGTFSEICRVRERRTGTHFALKRLRAEWCNEADARQLLVNEARAGRAVRSRHVVRVIESGLQDKYPWTVLEWLGGATLESELADGRLLPPGLALWIARQCVQGLLDLARAGFTHGDIKPDNIFLSAERNVTLIDLGFARRIDEPRPLSEGEPIVGTAEYMAPETLSRGPSNPVLRDIYSLGVTLFRMLTGRLPFEARIAARLLRLQRESRPPRVIDRRPGIPREVSDLVGRMLAKQPIRRPPSLSGLLRELVALELKLLPARFDPEEIEQAA